jgi:short-subunit dehydrogenase
VFLLYESSFATIFKETGHGNIVNIASLAGLKASPNMLLSVTARIEFELLA